MFPLALTEATSSGLGLTCSRTCVCVELEWNRSDMELDLDPHLEECLEPGQACVLVPTTQELHCALKVVCRYLRVSTHQTLQNGIMQEHVLLLRGRGMGVACQVWAMHGAPYLCLYHLHALVS